MVQPILNKPKPTTNSPILLSLNSIIPIPPNPTHPIFPLPAHKKCYISSSRPSFYSTTSIAAPSSTKLATAFNAVSSGVGIGQKRRMNARCWAPGVDYYMECWESVVAIFVTLKLGMNLYICPAYTIYLKHFSLSS